MTAREALRRVPLDVRALAVIALGIVVTHVLVIANGMSFNDPTWYFHFGNRVNHGDVPYRDFVFQGGPWPIYVDALFQQIFGTKYIASLYAGVCVKILRVWVIWMIARRVASPRAAGLLAAFCAFDTAFGFVHHWSTPWVDLLISLAGLLLLVASKAVTSGAERRALRYVALAGFSAALTLGARQSTTAVLAAMLLVSTVALAIRRDSITPRLFAALWGGFAVGVALVLALLAALGALRPAIQQMIIDAPAKKAVHGLPALLGALSGGGIVDWRYTYVTGFLFFIGLSALIAIAIVALASREDRPVSTSAFVPLAAPAALAVALFARSASLELTTDLPRTFLAVVVGLAVLVPDRARTWFGLEPLVALGLGGLFLSSDWALEMSAPGSGAPAALVCGVVLIALASSRIPESLKVAFCGALAAVALVHVTVRAYDGSSPFQELRSTDGSLRASSERAHLRGPGDAMLDGIEVTPWRARSIEWLSKVVEPGSTCFVYANMPSLYDLLDCKNPTRIDSTIVDFPSLADARRVAKALAASPPDYILAHDRMWMSPPLSQQIDAPAQIASWNPRVSFTLHRGLRNILDGYESLGTVAEAIGPTLANQAALWWDGVESMHVYRRLR